MANTEKLIVRKKASGDFWEKAMLYENKILGFEGTAIEAVEFARAHNFGGGVEVIEKIGNKTVFVSL